ncbi:MAG TPA: ABC transporter permease [Conexibacter sp.]|nr:ABC transporter permease [Conexibacter sp.]
MTATSQTQERPLPASGPARSRRHLIDLVLHLVRRDLASTHRNTLLGWSWPLVRQLAQLAVLVFLFSHVLDLGIPDYPAFVFTGLIAWTWFQTATIAASYSVVANGHLVGNPRFPTITLPLVAVAVPLFDVLMALPVLLVLLALDGRLTDTALLLPLLIAAQLAFMAGVALIVGAANVYLRDVQNAVGVLLLLLFYLTPVFYGLKKVPPQFHWLLRANPLTAFVNADRAALFDGTLPALVDVAIGSVAIVVALVAGLLLFRRLQPGFVDEL